MSPHFREAVIKRNVIMPGSWHIAQRGVGNCVMGSARERMSRRRITDFATDMIVDSVDRYEVLDDGKVRVTFFVTQVSATGVAEVVSADFALVLRMSAMPDAIGKALATTGRIIFARDDGSVTVIQ